MRPLRHRFVFVAGLLAVVGLAAACGPGIGAYGAPVAAVVGHAQISEGDVLDAVYLTTQPSAVSSELKGPGQGVTRWDTKRTALTGLISQTIALEKAGSTGVSVSPADVDTGMQSFESQFPTPAILNATLAQSHMTLAGVRYYERLNVATNKVFAAVTADINATPAQITQTYQQNLPQFQAEYDPAVIRLCTFASPTSQTCTVTAQDQALAQSILTQLNGGADFASLAKQYSADPQSRPNGGDLGWVDPNSGMQADLESAALALQPGQVSKVLNTTAGLLIVKLLAKGRPLDTTLEEAINTKIEQSPRQAAFQSWLQSAARGLNVKVNPGYGEWDPSQLSVDATPGSEPASSSQNTGLGGLSGGSSEP